MASIAYTNSTNTPRNANDANHRGSFAIMTSLFFLWGFMTVFNDILIPRFKEAFTLDYFHAMLVQMAFFGAYFIGSLIYFVISATTGDPIAKIGYKNGVVIGLLISATGSGLFWPAANAASYPMFLAALFIVGLGFAMLQIAANPYVTILGPERTASSRLNLAQGFNSIGTTIGPIIGGFLIYQYFAKTGAHGADSVKLPYLAFSVVFVVLAVIFFFIHLPHIGEGKIERGAGALKHPHVVLGVIAIFMYVGGEVSVGSAIINFLGQPTVAGLTAVEASKYVSLYWGGLMIGRFMGAVELSEMKKNEQADAAHRDSPARVFTAVGGEELPDGRAAKQIVRRHLHAMGRTISGKLAGVSSLSAVHRFVLVALPIRQGLGGSHADHLLADGRGTAADGDSGWRQNGDVVRGGDWFVHFDWLVKHIFAGVGRHGRIEEPGVVAAGDGDSRRRGVAAVARLACRCDEESSNLLHRPAHRLCLCRFLWGGGASDWT